MNKVCLALAFCVMGACISFLNFKEENTNFQKFPKQYRIDLAADQEYQFTKDPSLDKIPKYRLSKAIDKLSSHSKSDRNANNFKWDELGPMSVAGRVRTMHPILNYEDKVPLYIGSASGGVWFCEDILNTNPSWNPVHQDLPSLSVCAMEEIDGEIYFGTGEGFFNTNSFGGVGLFKIDDTSDVQYLSSTSSEKFQYIQEILVTDHGSILISTKDDGVLRSDNKGQSWAKVLGKGKFAQSDQANSMIKMSDGTLFVSMGINEQGGIFKSTDNGDNWSDYNSGLPSSGYRRIELASSASNKNTVYALYAAQDGTTLGLYKTKNQGVTWHKMNLPRSLGMSDFTRNQAWYNLTIEVSPSNSNRFIIGGIDLHISKNGGLSYSQISHHTGNNGLASVHADQHSVEFITGDDALISNDGGVYLLRDAFDWSRSFESKNKGLNVTQFYACDIHPYKDEFIAGSQDNGTQKFTAKIFSDTEEITGGDGAFCFIDQDDPSIQITSYIHNNYFVSTDHGNTFTYLKFNSDGFFANPSLYDSDDNILYASDKDGHMFRWSNPGFNSKANTIKITNLAGAKITSFAKSPSVPNLIYFGTNEGGIFKLNMAHSGDNRTAQKIFDLSGAQVISSISVNENDENHIICSLSNYGVVSLYQTKNGGANWSDCEGNLPDMPIRWALIDAQNPKGALIATEMGVWKSENLTGGATVWLQLDDGMPNVRVDMLKYRASDKSYVAATHGRGLYISNTSSTTSPIEEDAFLVQEQKYLQLSEAQAIGQDCNTVGVEIPMVFKLNKPANKNLNYQLRINYGDASSDDLYLEQQNLIFTRGQSQKTINLILHDDLLVEGLETAHLKISSTEDEIQGYDQMSINIIDNDEAFVLNTNSSGGTNYKIGSQTDATYQYPFKGYYEDQKSQMVYTADELIAAGMRKGKYSGLQLEITNKRSDRPFDNFTISIKQEKNIQLSDVGEYFLADGINYFNADVTTTTGINRFAFNQDFEWDGESDLLIQMCFNNNEWSYNDQVACSKTDNYSVLYQYADSNKGCDLDKIRSKSNIRPLITFYTGNDEAQISNTKFTSNSNISGHSSVVFLSPDGKLAGMVRSTTSAGLGCVSFSIDRDGVGFDHQHTIDGYASAIKSFYVETELSNPYELTLYYTGQELSEVDEALLKVFRSEDYISKLDDLHLVDENDYSLTDIGQNTYEITMNVDDAIIGVSAAVQNQFLGGVSTRLTKSDLKYFPNPFTTEMSCEIPGELEGMEATIHLMDLEGRILLKWTEVLHRELRISVNQQLKTGPYIIRTETEDDNVYNQRIIKI